MGESNRKVGGKVGAEQELDELTSIDPRRAGSEGERRAARTLLGRIEDMGREGQIEPTRVRPSFGITHLIHAVAGIVASVLSVYVPGAGLALAAVATVSAFGDLTGAFYLVRALTPARASQNVISDEDNDKPGLIMLVAHYDAPLNGLLSDRRLARWPQAIFASLGLITICALARLGGLDATWLTIIQFIPTVVLIVSTPLFADAAIAETSKGACDNAAGVAVALRLAGDYANGLDHFDVMLVLTGASAHDGLGMRAWLARHRKEVDPEATAVVSIDRVGSGEPSYAAKEGPVFAARMHPTLVEIARESATAFTSNEISDAYIARAAGLPSIRLSTTAMPDDDVPDAQAIDQLHDFAGRLLVQIDKEIGPLLG
jgi:hypothetical protein